MKEIYIGIKMGGYIDENNKIMSRQELNRRIVGMSEMLERAINTLRENNICIDHVIKDESEFIECEGRE